MEGLKVIYLIPAFQHFTKTYVTVNTLFLLKYLGVEMKSCTKFSSKTGSYPYSYDSILIAQLLYIPPPKLLDAFLE